MLTKTDLNEIGKIVKSSESRLDTKLNKLERKLDYAISFLGRDYLKSLERVERIEEHLILEPASI